MRLALHVHYQPFSVASEGGLSNSGLPVTGYPTHVFHLHCAVASRHTLKNYFPEVKLPGNSPWQRIWGPQSALPLLCVVKQNRLHLHFDIKGVFAKRMKEIGQADRPPPNLETDTTKQPKARSASGRADSMDL